MGSGWLRGAAAVLAALLLSGYVPPPHKILQLWTESALHPPGAGLRVLPVRMGGAAGELVIARPGRHALLLAGQPPKRDPGPGSADSLAGLWRTLDLFVLPPDDLSGHLEAAGIDLDRSGYGRTEQSGDGVAFTLGARGEGEPQLPQVWFSREPLWPVRVLPGWGDEVTVGPPGPGGWPAWFLIEGVGVLQVLGPPRSLDRLPDWVYDQPTATPESVPEGWRRAFGDRDR